MQTTLHLLRRTVFKAMQTTLHLLRRTVFAEVEDEDIEDLCQLSIILVPHIYLAYFLQSGGRGAQCEPERKKEDGQLDAHAEEGTPVGLCILGGLEENDYYVIAM